MELMTISMNVAIRCLLFAIPLATSIAAAPQERVPAATWQRYVDPSQAGFDLDRLKAAEETWKSLPSSAFMVIADGAIVADWGDTERRFMCHSVRKSFLSALYGIYYDRGELDLNKTLADLGMDDAPSPLLEAEKRARILDLLKARSGVFHPAAYAGRTDSRPRGSEGPGRYFAYNNWDFNTLATILRTETGAEVFQAFDEHFAEPLGMQDYRQSDGYYHYELDKSIYPAYPFRLSARDAARFGLLFAREGVWGDKRVLSKNWIRRSTAEYSIDSDINGYGFMWWTFREPRFLPHGMVAALGVGNQMIASLPESGLVIVNRANTYLGERTPTGRLLELVEEVLNARTGEPTSNPELVEQPNSAPLDSLTHVAPEVLKPFVGEWPSPPVTLNLPHWGTFTITAKDGYLSATSPRSGTFQLYVQPDGTLFEPDARRHYYFIESEGDQVGGLAEGADIKQAVLDALVAIDTESIERLLALVSESSDPELHAARVVVELLTRSPDEAQLSLIALAELVGNSTAESSINDAGYSLMRLGRPQFAMAVFQLNASTFPESFNAWDSLSEAQVAAGDIEGAIVSCERGLAINPDFVPMSDRLATLR